MASKRHFRRRSCENKVGYKTTTDAEAARRAVNHKRYTGPMNVYHCQFCGLYHIGHQRKGKKY